MDNKIHEKTGSIRETMMKMHKNGGKESVSDEELNQLMLDRFDAEVEVANIKKQYHDRFVKMLGVQKTADLYLAEMEFRRELMRKARGRGEGKHPGRDR